MEGNFTVYAQIGDDVFSENKFNEETEKYIRKRLLNFDWKSLQRLPAPKERMSFLGEIAFDITIQDVWIWHTADDGFYENPGLRYTIFIEKIEILENHRRKIQSYVEHFRYRESKSNYRNLLDVTIKLVKSRLRKNGNKKYNSILELLQSLKKDIIDNVSVKNADIIVVKYIELASFARYDVENEDPLKDCLCTICSAASIYTKLPEE